MLEMFQYRFAVVAIITISLVLNRTHSHVANFHKRGNVDVFNLLLSLYKLNPLKGSKVYKTFSEKVLSRGEKAINAVPTDSSEKNDIEFDQKPTIKELNEIEMLIHPHYKQQLHSSIGRPEYDIENVDTEKFNVDIVVNDKLVDEYENRNTKHANNGQIENFSGLLSRLSSNLNEITDDVPSTKLIPVNDSDISRTMSNTKLYPIKDLHDKKNLDEMFEGIADGTVVQVDNDIDDAPIMNDNVVAADVIVL